MNIKRICVCGIPPRASPTITPGRKHLRAVRSLGVFFVQTTILGVCDLNNVPVGQDGRSVSHEPVLFATKLTPAHNTDKKNRNPDVQIAFSEEFCPRINKH